MAGKIVVFGSYHWFGMFSAPVIPKPGESVAGSGFSECWGGKGTTQAVMAKRFGGDVAVLGRVGKDASGEKAVRDFLSMGIDCTHVSVDEAAPTGSGAVWVDDAGNNAIVIVAGANANISRADVDAAGDLLAGAAVLSAQFEVNPAAVQYAFGKARAMGVTTFLDPSPLCDIGDDFYKVIDYFNPNEHEAAHYSGLPVYDAASAVKAGEWFLQKGVGKGAIITLGGQGAVLVTPEGARHFKAPPVQVVDTTDAGDCFAGALICALAAGEDIAEAIRYGSCSGAVATTITDGLPEKAAVDALYARYGDTL